MSNKIEQMEVTIEMDIMSQIYAVIIFGAMVILLPWGLNKWSDTRAGVR